MKCINVQCQKEIGEMLFCPYCGTKQVKPKVFCAYCGAEMDDDAVFCDNCGRKSFLVQQRELEAQEDADRKAREEVAERLTHILGGLTKHAEKKAKEEADRKAFNGHEWIDLGLSVKWAAYNLGADSPEDPGDYFAWGETIPKQSYQWNNYKFCINSDSVREERIKHPFLKSLFGKKKADIHIFSKYNIEEVHGTVDNKVNLELCDDAARANWGGKWRMPTDAEWTELLTKCTWIWTTEGGKNGYKVTSKTNGNSIFLPAAGYRDTGLHYVGVFGYYRSSSLDTEFPSRAWYVFFSSDSVYGGHGDRYYGHSIRPVSE